MGRLVVYCCSCCFAVSQLTWSATCRPPCSSVCRLLLSRPNCRNAFPKFTICNHHVVAYVQMITSSTVHSAVSICIPRRTRRTRQKGTKRPTELWFCRDTAPSHTLHALILFYLVVPQYSTGGGETPNSVQYLLRLL